MSGVAGEMPLPAELARWKKMLAPGRSRATAPRMKLPTSDEPSPRAPVDSA
jgi:hypothetical protein